MPAVAEVVHGTAVAFGNRAVLIVGPSGSGKSGLALQLMALGAGLVADDQVALRAADGVVVDAPPGLPAMIEARGVGLLAAQLCGPADLALVVDLGVAETERLPPFRVRRVLGREIALVHAVAGRHFPAAIAHYIHAGRSL